MNPNNKTQELLKELNPISIQEMDRVRLLSRTDRKFLMDTNELHEFLEKIGNDYAVLEMNGKRLLRYETSYFDTPELKLYFMHLHGVGKRFKVRKRFYRDSSTGFFELKTKTNQGKTEKQRIENTSDERTLSQAEKDLLQNELPFSPDELEMGLFTGYDRITLVNKERNERVTIDLGLFFIHREVKKEMHNLVIVEVKQDQKFLSAALKALRNLRRKPGGLSKYCLGLIVTNPDLRFNRFKPLTLKVNKLIRATTT